MAIDFSKNRDKDIEEITDKLFAKLQKQGLIAEEIGEQVGESFADGIDQGFEDAASRIVASSVKITKAFKDLAKKLVNQNISLSGINIDFSDIDIDSAEFQKRINEAFEKIKIDGGIKFDSKTSEKQFKNILGLHIKYAEKLSRLQEQKPRFTNPESIKVNAKEQLALVDGLKEIRRTLNDVSDASISLPYVRFGDTKALQAEINLLDQITKGEQKAGKQRDTNIDKIKKENKELKERNKLLEEKVGSIKEEQPPPARTSRTKKTKKEEYDPVEGKRRGEEMIAFGTQLESLQGELGDTSKWLNRYNKLMVQIQQGSLTAAEAVAKLREEMTQSAAVSSGAKNAIPNYSMLPKEGKMILYHNTSAGNVDSILKNGLKADAGKGQGRGKDGDLVWATTVPNQKGYGGNTIAFQIDVKLLADNPNWQANDVEYHIPVDIPAEDILFVDRPVTNTYRESDIADLVRKFGVDKVKDVLGRTKNNNSVSNDRIDELVGAAEKAKPQAQSGTQQEIKSQEELQKKIVDTNRVIKIQKQWLEHLDPVLNESNYKTSGKREATEQLKNKTLHLLDVRRHPEEYAHLSDYGTKAELAQSQAYKEAERQGVAQSTLSRYFTDAVFVHDQNIKKLQEERELHTKILSDAENELAVLQQQSQAETRIAKVRNHKFTSIVNGKSGKFGLKPKASEVYETDSGQLSMLPVVEAETDAKNRLAESNEKVARSQKNINDEMQGTQLTIDDIIPESAEDTIPKVETEAQELDKVGEAAEKAAGKKKKFAKANKDVAASVGPSVAGLDNEVDAIENVGEAAEKVKTTWSTTRPNVEPIHLVDTSDTLDNFNLPSVYMGEQGQEAVQVFAKLKSEIEEMTGKPATIDFVSEVNENGQLEAVGATLKYINEEAGITVKQFYDIARNEDGVVVATQSHERATLSATKAAKAFNTEMQKKLAGEQIKTLESRMGSLKDSTGDFTKALTDAKTAAANIDGEEGLKEFNLSLRVAGEKAKQLKSELKGQNTLDTIASMERALLTLPSRLDEVQRKLNGLGDIEGTENVSDVIKSIQVEYQRFLTTGNAEDKVKLFRSLTSSMVWVNAELKNLSGKNIEMKRQETEAEKEELAKQKVARESYLSWWKTTINEQDEVDDYERSLLKREQQEKAKDERVIAARKKKEEEYDAWWQKALFKQERAPNLKYGKTTADSARRKLDSTEGAVDALGVTNPKVLAKLDDYKNKVKEIEDIRAKFESDSSAAEDKGLVKQFQKASYEAEQLRRGIKAITDEEQKMMQMSEEQGFNPVELTPDQVANLKNEMIAHAKATAQGRMEIKGWKDDHTKMNYTVTNSKGVVEEMTLALGRGTNKMYQYRTATKETGTLMEQVFKGIKVKAKELLSFVIGGGSVYKAIEVLRQGIQYVREIDLALTELKKVTDETEETYDRFLETASKTAEKVGSTIKDVVSSTADWARLGYSMEEAAELAESTQILMNVSEFTDVSQATDTLISSVQAFGYTAETSMEVVDLLNTIGNNYAISTADLAQSLTKSSASLVAAGGDLAEAAALTATANKIIQDADSVGTALKTTSLRLRGTDVKVLEEEGLDSDGAVTSKSKLQSKVKALSGVDILTETGEYKSTYKILSDIADVWGTINDMDQAALLELISGKRNSSVIAAILQNPKELKEALEDANNASGSALKENEKHLDSIQGKIDQFNNATQTMWSNFLDDDAVKFVVELGTALIRAVDAIGLLNSAVLIFAGSKLIPWVLKAATGRGTFGESLKYIGLMITSINGTGKALIPTLIAESKAAYIASTANGVLGKSLAALKAGFTTLMATPLGWFLAAAAAVAAVVVVVDSLTTSAKEAAQAAEEALTAYNNAQNTLKSHKQTIEDISDDYKKFSKGVDAFGKNVSLTTEEYERYNEVANQIAEMFPQMVTGYTEEGNAILSLKGNVEELTEAYKAEAQAANDAILITSNDIFKTFKNSTKSGSILTGEHDKLEDLKYIEDLLDGQLDNFEAADFAGTAGLDRWFEAAGIEGPSFWDVILGNAGFEDYMAILRDNLPKLQAYYRTLKTELQAEVAPIKTMIGAYLSQDFDYMKLSNEGQKMADAIVSGFDSEFYSNFTSASQLQGWITTNVVQPLQNTDIQLQAAFDLQTKFNSGEVPIEEYEQKIKDIIGLIDALDLDKEDSIIKSLRLVFNVDENGSTNVAAQNIAKNLLDDQYDSMVGQLNLSDLDIIDKNKDKWQEELAISGKTTMSWDELITKIEEAKQVIKETSITDSFDKISSLEEAYNSLGDAIKEFKEEGTASSGTLKDLNEIFGDTDGFEELYKVLATGEGDVETAIANVANAYIGQKDMLSDLTDDERQIMVARLKALGVINAEEIVQSKQVAQEKLDTAYEQYGIDLGNYATAEEAKLMIAQQLGLNISAIEGDTIADLEEKYGIDLSNYSSVAEAKIKIAQEVARQTAEANKSAAMSELNSAYVGSERNRQGYKDKRQEIEKAYADAVASIPSNDVLSGIQSIVDDYYSTPFKFDFSNGKVGIGRDFDDDLTDKAKDEAEDAFQKAMDYWENRIGANQARYEQLQNEIDLLEKKGQKANADYYNEQIKLENQRLSLLQQQKAEAQSFLGTFAEGSEEWF